MIASVLQDNSSITHVLLNDNGISDEGARAIAGALDQNSAVRHADVDGNAIGEAGGKSLLLSLSSNAALRRLDCFSEHLKSSTTFARLLATTHHKRPEVKVSFSR